MQSLWHITCKPHDANHRRSRDWPGHHLTRAQDEGACRGAGDAGADLDEVSDGAQPVESLLVERHVGLLAEEHGVGCEDEQVATLQPPQTLPPHRAGVQRHL